MTVYEAGGGGFGDPQQRDINAVVKDVTDGFVSEAGAQSDYGVNVDVRAKTGKRI